MSLTLESIEKLAPDQASLKAASRLRGPAKWSLRARDPESGLVWGECQGSGANPYRVIADTTDHGYKCTCPSRKFPCKHALALMWMFVEQGGAFGAASAPDWVVDWVGRRRKSAGGKPEEDEKKKGRAKKSLADAEREPDAEATPPDPRAWARRRRAAVERAEATRRSVLAATRDLDRWIADQLRAGLSGLLAELGDRCRRIASRLVDAKAAGLASRLDELPARVLALPGEERLDAVVGELGRLVLLVRAWRAEPDDPELHRTVVSAESREQVEQDSAALRVTSRWEVLGEQISTRRDGLISQATWLLNLERDDPGDPPFALLLDFHPATAGRRGRAFEAGDRFAAELVFYRARRALRAIVGAREDAAPASEAWRAPDPGHPLATFLDHVEAAPWLELAPVLLPGGRICETEDRRYWWCAHDRDWKLPIATPPPRCALGMDLEQLAALWSGHRLVPLAAQSDWGRIAFDA